MGVNATWDLVDALTPTVPFFQRVVSLVENSFDLRRSSKHTLPDDSTDIAGLVRTYVNGRINHYQPKRPSQTTIKDSEPKDALAVGSAAIQDPNYLRDIFEERWIYLAHENLEDGSSDRLTSFGPHVSNLASIVPLIDEPTPNTTGGIDTDPSRVDEDEDDLYALEEFCGMGDFAFPEEIGMVCVSEPMDD